MKLPVSGWTIGPRTRRYLLAAVPIVLFAIAGRAIHRFLEDVTLADVSKALSDTSGWALLAALVLTAISYLLLTLYDVLGLRYLGRELPYRVAAFASFVSYAFSHNIGVAVLTGGAIRYRVYSALGLSAAEVATLTAFCGMTFGLGVGLVLSFSLILEPDLLKIGAAGPPALYRVLGWGIAAALILYLLWSGKRATPITLGHWRLRLPTPTQSLAQSLLGLTDITVAAAVLYVLLPASAAPAPGTFVGLFVAAMFLGLVSHTPGGIGVFEAVMLALLPGNDQAGVLASLLLFRIIYYLLPFLLAASLLLARERPRRLPRASATWAATGALARAVMPQLLGVATFLSGVALLISAATPAVAQRLATLREFLPLPFVEASHMASSLVGALLVLLSRGLFRRLDGAWRLTVALLSAAVPFSLLKGGDWEEALMCTGVLAALLLTRSAFYRRSGPWRRPLSAGWLVAAGVVLVGWIGFGYFAFKHLEYRDVLWWEFSYDSDAPRTVRAMLAVTVMVSALLVIDWIRRKGPAAYDQRAIEPVIRRLVSGAHSTHASLALLGDKQFLLSNDASAFLMYRTQRRTRVAMGDPVGDRGAWPELAWRFRELCDADAETPVFYQVPSESLPLYLDLGLSPLKLGDEAWVDLSGFELAGPRFKSLRHAVHRAERGGASFDVIPASAIDDSTLRALRRVSDAWLQTRNAREKGFSLGRFSRAYLQAFDCAVVRKNGNIVAFANLLQAPSGGELSVDLMRHDAEAPPGTMDFLFVRVMQWGAGAGYRWFNMGMAPLSGLTTHPLGPIWQRLGTLLYRHGEHFYNFEGLRAYKAKFDPDWRPRYLMAPAGISLPGTLMDVISLIAGGGARLARLHLVTNAGATSRGGPNGPSANLPVGGKGNKQ